MRPCLEFTDLRLLASGKLHAVLFIDSDTSRVCLSAPPTGPAAAAGRGMARSLQLFFSFVVVVVVCRDQLGHPLYTPREMSAKKV